MSAPSAGAGGAVGVLINFGSHSKLERTSGRALVGLECDLVCTVVAVVPIAPDHAVLSRLSDATQTALAWAGILDDVDRGPLNIDRAQKRQAQQEAKSAAEVLPQAMRETRLGGELLPRGRPLLVLPWHISGQVRSTRQLPTPGGSGYRHSL